MLASDYIEHYRFDKYFTANFNTAQVTTAIK